MENKTKTKVTDTGLRGRFNGELYVDKKVFFKREDVRNVIKSLKESESLNKHIKASRKSLNLI
ncbi:MAG: hypothetical protein LAT51_01035 [Flavobacteriaceae bacterium]|nr:hypothetical protein [Flavobacteriaceae bacterium]